MVMLIILILFAVAVAVFVAWLYVIPWFYGAPYDISRREALKNIIKLTAPKSGDKIAELGSGDGRVCIALALRAGKNSKIIIHGYEINPFLVWFSRRKIRKLKLQKHIKIYWKNFWKANLSKYNKIIFFQFSTITSRLEKKFDAELKRGTKIISHNWKLPNWKIKHHLGKKHLSQGIVYEYEKS